MIFLEPLHRREVMALPLTLKQLSQPSLPTGMFKTVSVSCLVLGLTLTSTSLPTLAINARDLTGRSVASAQSSRYRSYEIPAGAVLKLRLNSQLTSKTNRVGDTFTATVFEPYLIDGKAVVPQGTQVEGHVSSVEPAQRDRSGTIAVDFDYLIFENGKKLDIGQISELTSLKRDEKQQIDAEGKTSGGSTTKRKIIFTGGGAGAGAVIGAIAGGGKGAAIGSAIGAGAGILTSLLLKGEEAVVKSGQEFGLEFLQKARISDEYLTARSTTDTTDRDRDTRDRDTTDRDTRDRNTRDRDTRDRDTRDRDTRDRYTGSQRDPYQEYTDPQFIRRAQLELRTRGFYTSTIGTTLTSGVRSAISRFQRDQRLEETGKLDLPTAQALNLVDRDGNEIRLVKVLAARAVRQADRSIQVVMDTEVPSGGWDLYGDYEIRTDKLEVWARGVAPAGAASQVITKGTIEVVPREDVSRIQTVLIHTDTKDLTVAVEDMQTGIAKSLRATADRMLSTLKTQFRSEQRGATRTAPSTISWRLNENEARLYSAVVSLAEATRFYAELVETRATEDAQRGAAEALARGLNRVDRVMRSGRVGDRIQRDVDDFDKAAQQLTDYFRIDARGND